MNVFSKLILRSSFENRVLLFILIHFVTLPFTTLHSEPNKLALIGSKSADNLLDLIASKYSSNNDFKLLEREQLSSLVNEKTFQNFFNSGSYSEIGKLIGANALIIVTDRQIQGKWKRYAHLVATSEGVLLAARSLGTKDDHLEVQSNIVVEYFAPFLKKLSHLSKKTAIPISFMGFKFELGEENSMDREDQFNTLLTHRLLREKQLIVLERWRLKTALFEKHLNDNLKTKFWSGRFLLDGSFEKKAGGLIVKMRLKSSTQKEIIRQYTVKVGSLNSVIHDLVSDLIPLVGASKMSTAWNPVAEGKRFADLGTYALANHMYRESYQAFETSRALGFSNHYNDWLMAKAYMRFVCSVNFTRLTYPEEKKHLNLDDVDESIRAMTRCHEIMDLFFSRNKGKITKAYWDFKKADFKMHLISSRTLFLLQGIYTENKHLEHKESLKQLRKLYLKNVTNMRKTPYLVGLRGGPIYTPMFQYWTEGPDHIMNILRKDPRYLHHIRMDNSFMRQESKLRHPLIDWSRPSNVSLDELWVKFIEEHLTSDDPVKRFDGLRFRYAMKTKHEDRLKAAQELWKHIWEIRKRFADPKRLPHLSAISRHFRDSFYTDMPSKIKKLRFDFLKFFLNQPGSKFGAFNMNDLAPHYTRYSWSNKEVVVLSELIDRRLASKNDESLISLKQWVRYRLPKTSPLFKKNSKVDLVIDKYISVMPNKINTEIFSDPYAQFTTKYHQGNIWFSDSKRNLIYRVNPVSGSYSSFPCPKGDRTKELIYLDQATSIDVNDTYLCLVKDNLAWKYHLKDKIWTRFNVPMAKYRGRIIGEWFYLIYNYHDLRYHGRKPPNTVDGNGVFRFHLENNTKELWISSRRKIPEHNIDGKGIGNIVDVFQTLNNRIHLVFAKTQYLDIYQKQLDTKVWNRISYNMPMANIFNPVDKGVLFFGLHMDIELYSHGAEQPEQLIQKYTRPNERGFGRKTKTVWKFPKSIKRNNYRATMKDEVLYIFDHVSKSIKRHPKFNTHRMVGLDHRFIIFQKSSPKPTFITCRFSVPGKTKRQLSGKHSIVDQPRISRLIATEKGLVFICRSNSGIWYLPYSKIHPHLPTLKP